MMAFIVDSEQLKGNKMLIHVVHLVDLIRFKGAIACSCSIEEIESDKMQIKDIYVTIDRTFNAYSRFS